MSRPFAVLVVSLASIAALAACGKDREKVRDPAAADQAKVLATVNGVPITELDLEQRAKGAVTGGGPGHEASANVLATVVREELVYQKAVQLGLDAEPGYREKVDQLEAQLRAVKRQQLAVLYRQYVQNQAVPTEADARTWFEKNAELVRTRYHVLQILDRRGPTELAKDRDEVKSGTPFEAVAARRFPAIPANARAPWDLGELPWQQIPPAWRGIVDRLEPGQVSDVIQGENERFWLIKLVGKRVDPAVSFETEKERIVEVLRQERAAALYASLLAEMKANSRIVYSK